MNETIFFFFYNLAHQSQFFDGLVIFLAEYFPYLVIFFALIFLLSHHDVLSSGNPFGELKRRWKEIVLAFLVSGCAWLVARVLKIFLYTNRPFAEFPNVQPLFFESGFAFPSGHATFFMALAAAIFFYHKKTGCLFIFFAVVIGIARIIAGVHFPIDILGGFILGAGVAYFIKIFKQIHEK